MVVACIATATSADREEGLIPCTPLLLRSAPLILLLVKLNGES